MGLTAPNDARDTTDTTPDLGGHTPAYAHAHAYAPAREGSHTAETAESGAGGEVRAVPRGDTSPDTRSDYAVAPSRARSALQVWTRETADTATAAVDGSVWRARPASLRDREARVRRAEWSGGLPALAVPGRVYGYLIALPATVVLRAAEQAVSRPVRLLVLVLAVLIPLLVA